MKIKRKSHQQLQQLAMRRLQLASQLIGIQISYYVGCSLPAPPRGDQCGRILPPTVSRNSHSYKTNDKSVAEEPVAFLASVLFLDVFIAMP